ncbi:hypothetical protein CPB84DRAFT_1960342 [Gymnopilus junonius]|uniref:Uncharacterized protein n=1 Tax=Gymnopilus junonius TaxID=109634 RepID=A0A9P5TR16_GYMJU|nr:hypothetical protein CPB84DRAFT_1960342 [Gymnopilus junonius]
MTEYTIDAPPAYDTLSLANPVDDDSASYTAHGLVPTYAPPAQFKIGRDPSRDLPTLEREKRWAWFIGLAVERFDLWCQNLTIQDADGDPDVVIPPMDVLMVWHTYMLNPRWYREDSMLIERCKVLRRFERHFLHLMENPSSMTLTSFPSAARVDYWQAKTAMPFDLLESLHTMKCKLISCPKCGTIIEVDVVNAQGTGYLQQQFATSCPMPGCNLGEITKGTLGLRKLAEDLASPNSGLAGTYFTSSSLVDTKRGDFLKKKISEISQSSSAIPLASYIRGSSAYQEALIQAIMEHFKYSIADLRDQMRILTQPSLVGRIMAAHSDDKVYSVELTGAVLRQGSFIAKMHDLGWTHPGFFDRPDDELALQHALARYHAFLDLMASSPTSFFVPTLDIDLVWHTHQLMPQKYGSDCRQYVKRFIDHDDKVEGLRLSSAFDITCRAWKSKFNVEYTHCGCPIPGKSIGERLSRMVKLHNDNGPPSHLLPYDRPDLLSATHPSDHNAVRFAAKTEDMHEATTKKYKDLAIKKKFAKLRKAQEDAAMAAKGQQGKTGGKYGNEKSQVYDHEFAFLVPVPIFFPAGRTSSETDAQIAAALADVEQEDAQPGPLVGVVAVVVVVEGAVEVVAEAGVAEEDDRACGSSR